MTLLSRVKNITPDNTPPLNVAYYWKQPKWLCDFVDMKLFCRRFKWVLESNVRTLVRFVSGLLTCSLMSHLLIRKVNLRHAGAVFRVFVVLSSRAEHSATPSSTKTSTLVWQRLDFVLLAKPLQKMFYCYNLFSFVFDFFSFVPS